MASAPNAAQALAEYEQIYQPKVFNVKCVEALLTGLVKVFVVIVTVVALSALVVTVGVACFVGGKAWLREHALPELPQVD
mmetsp:Transcript_30474/g.61360  ORF Transcript_30474/g.61360 Transcript_30474/m.61360 type:complete len:80 (-) Transcript_30474:128-367(-)